MVVEVTAPASVRRDRLCARGREDPAGVAERLARLDPPLPPSSTVLRIANDGLVAEGVERLVTALEAAAARMALRRLPIAAGRVNLAYLPADSSALAAAPYLGNGRIEVAGGGRSLRATVNVLEAGWHLQPREIGLSAEAFDRLGLPEGAAIAVRRTPPPGSRALLRRKIAGGRLTADEYEVLFRDIMEDHYPDTEVAAFLVQTIRQLDDAETVAVAQARCRFTPRIDWHAPIVLDKHSLGGVPGSRITLVVVPIVAEHGLLMPKTSSRAITSAAGTADVMEAACRVDLDAAAIQRVVRACGGCIAWNGRLNHSVLDDVVNAITRPLGLDSNRWSAASILSKKWSAGATHVVVDMPWGVGAKLRTAAEAEALGRVFERVGAGLGLTVRALATDGQGAIGRGIGPALELRDVRQVLSNDPAAPADLRAKALRFAAEVLAFDPAVGDAAAGLRRARALLGSGAAEARFDRIVAAQGANPAPALPGARSHVVRAGADVLVTRIDGWQLAGIARQAGAPADKSAGIDLAAAVGHCVPAGAALYTIHSASAAGLEAAAAMAARDTGLTLEARPCA